MYGQVVDSECVEHLSSRSTNTVNRLILTCHIEIGKSYLNELILTFVNNQN